MLVRIDYHLIKLAILLKLIYICTKESDMSTIELRHAISEYLTHIDDASFLNAIKTIIESKVTEGTYKLSEYQIERIGKGRKQLRTGQTISSEAIKQEIDQWLSTK
jgi:hypothetical protein